MGWEGVQREEERALTECTEQASFSHFPGQGITLGQNGGREAWLLLLDGEFTASPDALPWLLARAGDRETCPALLHLMQWKDLGTH